MILPRFLALDSQEKRASLLLQHPFIAPKFSSIQRMDCKQDPESVRAREEGNVRFQVLVLVKI